MKIKQLVNLPNDVNFVTDYRRNVIIETSLGPLSMMEAAQIAGITYAAMQKRRELGLAGDDLLVPKYTRLPRSTTF